MKIWQAKVKLLVEAKDRRGFYFKTRNGWVLSMFRWNEQSERIRVSSIRSPYSYHRKTRATHRYYTRAPMQTVATYGTAQSVSCSGSSMSFNETVLLNLVADYSQLTGKRNKETNSKKSIFFFEMMIFIVIF